MKIIQSGAEAIIILEKNIVTKKRLKKSYRIDEIDEKIRKQRTRSEVKILEKASRYIPVPSIKKADEKDKEIQMEFIDGIKLSEGLDDLSLKEQIAICKKIGENIGRIHENGIIHGDLTTSNMILKDGEVYFLDFGLGFISHKIEDMAVDLHVLREALEARHFKNWEKLFESVREGYKESKKSILVLKQFEKVEKRGRYKDQY